mmetsp:Transcript_29926/g.69614  ORF Transcript_29926/g.69614 Transcript_29926/m.69614 type:complete len:377 (+) Transcript_29926:28-1158(+)
MQRLCRCLRRLPNTRTAAWDPMSLQAQWFEALFGFQEETGSDYATTQANFVYSPDDGVLASKCTDRKYIAGRFFTPSLGEMRNRTDLKNAAATLGAGSATLKELVDDVTALHAHKENYGALFQAASQFNCLEHTSSRGTAEEGITIYSFDRTQGPACAIACAPGTIVRNYKVKLAAGEGQTATRQVQNLQDIESDIDNAQQKYFKVVNGYTLATNDTLDKLNPILDEALKERLLEKLRIGVQEDTEVTCLNFGRSLYNGPQQLVTQAYCSAISVAYSQASDARWEKFARLILEGAFEATFYASVENALRNPDSPGSRKLYLTALGGGVFGNDLVWIADAIEKCMEKFKDLPLEVHIVSFRSPVQHPRMQELLAKWK